MEKRIIVAHGMVKEIAVALDITERSVYNALRGITKGKKSLAARHLAEKKLKELNN